MNPKETIAFGSRYSEPRSFTLYGASFAVANHVAAGFTRRRRHLFPRRGVADPYPPELCAHTDGSPNYIPSVNYDGPSVVCFSRGTARRSDRYPAEGRASRTPRSNCLVIWTRFSPAGAAVPRLGVFRSAVPRQTVRVRERTRPRTSSRQ